ncbi:cytochrome P450 71A1-like isoform X1 [Iris pallida]|uniref:Cytochrome P450 71A1-like isoform X1 n=1 Tax=Iris pallida TaxID=29817 RepID=A0AAX6HE15_IRIPA|nr:cytochrome P450 71A1-like isoform X1 [Iris pallida]
MALTVLMLLLFLLLLLPVLFLFSKRKPKLKLPPGPRPVPIFGNLLQIGDIPHHTIYELSKTYGPIFYMRMGQIPVVSVTSPALAEEVLRKLDLVCCTRPHMTAFQEYTFNYCDVSAAPYGDNWRILRKVFVVELLSNKKLSFFRGARQAETDKMIESIRNRPDQAAPINIKDFMVRLSNNIVCRVTFGHMNEGIYGERSQLHALLEEGNRMLDEIFFGDFFPGFGWIDWLTGKRKRMQKIVKELGDFFQQMIDKHKENFTKRGEDHHDKEDFIDVMIRLCKEEGSQITTDHIKGSIMDIITGGTDTSASTVTWAMSQLARHPRVMKKAQEELRRVVGDKGKVEESDLPHCEYLKLVMNETLRLHAQNPLLRETMEDCKIDGYDIPKGTRVIVSAWAIARDEDAWENALEFFPERFEGSSINFWGNDFQYLPFGAGRRICPGINFGMHTVSLALANLLYTFDWELPVGTKEGDIDLDDAPGFVTYKKTPLLLVPKNRY